ncbi:hypothetical protein C0J52_09799 [Blattella germanica]|nr:hypothetical protein C0J52_09799 [Blattella germanica]
MNRWTGEQWAFAIKAYYKNNDSFIAAQRLFRLHYNIHRNDPVPSAHAIKMWVQNFEVNGPALKKFPGKQRSVRTPDNINTVRVAIARTPKRSARRHAISLGLSNTSLRRILHKDLHMHAYKIQISDEAHFHLSGYVNKQNFRYWSQTNPYEMHEVPLHSVKVTVWCAIASFGIIGPYFFEDDNGRSVTVTSQRYVRMIEEFLSPQIANNPHINRDTWFQQDGATSHTARCSMDAVRRLFPTHIVYRYGDIAWPARSPDLTACDFFLWGYLKSVVFRNPPPHNTEELKERIRHEIAEIPADMLRRVMGNIQLRLEECMQRNGSHLRDIVFRK